jgi:hypothetical protein
VRRPLSGSIDSVLSLGNELLQKQMSVENLTAEDMRGCSILIDFQYDFIRAFSQRFVFAQRSPSVS